MSALVPVAKIAWDDLLEVVIVGSVAGIGLSIAFAFLVRSVIQAGDARRDGRGTAAALPHAALAALTGVICLGAVVFAVYEMVTG